jgi:hypothetical protein
LHALCCGECDTLVSNLLEVQQLGSAHDAIASDKKRRPGVHNSGC